VVVYLTVNTLLAFLDYFDCLALYTKVGHYRLGEVVSSWELKDRLVEEEPLALAAYKVDRAQVE